MIKRLLLCLIAFSLIANAVLAQETVYPLPTNLEVITPENVDRIEEIARIGNGGFNGGVRYSPDGTVLAVGGSLGIWLYDATDFSASPELIDLDAPIYDVQFSSDGQYLVYGVGRGSGVHIMDFATREDILQLGGSQFAIHPSENLLAVAYQDLGRQPPYTITPVIEIWNFTDGELIKSFHFQRYWEMQGYITELAFSPDGESLGASISGFSYDTCGTAYVTTALFNLNGGEHQIPRIIRNSNYVAFSPNGRLTAGILEYEGGPNAGIIQTWNIRQWEARVELANKDWIMPQDFVFSPDSQTLTAITYDKMLRWNPYTGELLNEIELDALESLNGYRTYWNTGSLTYSPNGERIAILRPTSLQIWDHLLSEHITIPLDDSLANGQIHPSGNLLVVRDNSQQTRIWTLNDATTHILQTPEKFLNYRISSSGEVIIFTQGNDLHVRNINAHNEGIIRGGFSYEDQLWLSDDGSLLAQWTPTSEIHLWNTETREFISTLRGEFPLSGDLWLSPDNATVVTSQIFPGEDLPQEGDQSDYTRRVSLILWDVSTGQLRQNLGESLYDGVNVAFNPEGSLLGVQNQFREPLGESYSEFRYATSSRIFNVQTGALEFSQQYSGQYDSFSPDLSNFIADTGDWSNIILTAFDTQTTTEIMPTVFVPYAGGVSRLSPNGQQMLVQYGSYTGCGGDYRALDVYDLQNGTLIRHIGLSPSYLGFSRETVDFTQDSQLMLLTTPYSIRFYDELNEKSLFTLENTGNLQASFNSDDTLIVTTGTDGTIRLYGVLSE